MDKLLFFSNLFTAIGAQLIALMASFAMSFLVPKILSVSEFGYWQLFIFYSGYVGFFLFGLNGGIYLKEGGKNRTQIDCSVKYQIFFGLFLEIIIFIFGLIVTSFFSINSDRRDVLLFTAIYLLICNTNDLFGYVFQAINETRVYSRSILIDRILFLLSVICFVVIFKIDNYIFYVALFLTTKSIGMLYTLTNARFLFRGFSLSYLFNNFKSVINNTIDSLSAGFKLMLSTIATMLILGSARFAIDSAWDIETFGQFSLAVSLENFVILFVSQVAMVLFPVLKKMDISSLKSKFVFLRDSISIFIPIVYILYIPLKLLLNWWLPQYADSLLYLSALLPVCVFDSKMNLVGTTFFKVLRKENTLLIINLATLLVCIPLVFVSSVYFHSIFLVIGSVVVSIFLRCEFSDFIVSRTFSCRYRFISYSEIIFTFIYLFVISTIPFPFSIIFFFIIYTIYLLFNYEAIKLILNQLISLIRT